MILTRRLTPGTLIRLQPIAERNRVSITPVREALVLLEQQGWVVQEPNRGFRVAKVRQRDVEDLARLQMFLYAEMAARAALRMTSEAIDEIRTLDAELRSTPVDQVDIHTILNRRVHALISHWSDAPRLRGFLDASLFLAHSYDWGDIPGWVQYNRLGHGEVISALEARDPELAASTMAHHIARAQAILIEHLASIGFFSPDDEPSDERPDSGILRVQLVTRPAAQQS